MSNATFTTNDSGSVALGDNEYRNEVMAFAGADDLAEGTLLARHTGNGKLQLYVKGGSSNGNGVVCGVLPYAVSAAGAVDVPVRLLISGKVNKNRLVIDADGDDTNIDGAVIDLIRDRGIVPLETSQLADLDNLGGADS